MKFSKQVFFLAFLGFACLVASPGCLADLADVVTAVQNVDANSYLHPCNYDAGIAVADNYGTADVQGKTFIYYIQSGSATTRTVPVVSRGWKRAAVQCIEYCTATEKLVQSATDAARIVLNGTIVPPSLYDDDDTNMPFAHLPLVSPFGLIQATTPTHEIQTTNVVVSDMPAVPKLYDIQGTVAIQATVSSNVHDCFLFLRLEKDVVQRTMAADGTYP